jgi:peptidyl-prolyl cis-trans isomerase C
MPMMIAEAEAEAMPALELSYLLLGIAEQKFQCAPAQLNSEQRREAERIARRQAELERRVLGSEEAVNVIVPPSEVEGAFERIRARYTSPAEFDRELLANALDEIRLRAALARELKVEAVLACVAARTPPVDETELRLYYYLHLDQFQQPETRIARHILITINPTYPENQRDAAFQRAREIARRLARKPDRFAEQAMKHSECPTALQGGLIGRVKRGSLYPQLDAELFAMREGAISDVLESEIGFHVLLCEKIHRDGVAPLGEVLPKLREQMTAREVARAQKRWIEQLRARADF